MRRTVIPLNRGLYELLVDAARAGEPLSYNDVGRLLELSLDYPPHRNEMEQLLGVISRHEAASGRPLLTSIVLRKDEGSGGGAGFFRLGQQLGMVLDREGAQAFSARQLKETIEFWQSSVAPSVDEAIGGPTRTAADLQAEEDQLRAEMELMDAGRQLDQAPAAPPDQLDLEAAQAARTRERRQPRPAAAEAPTPEPQPPRARSSRASAQRQVAPTPPSPTPTPPPPPPAAAPPPTPPRQQSPPRQQAAQPEPPPQAPSEVEEWPAEPGLDPKSRAARAQPSSAESVVELGPPEPEPRPQPAEPEPEPSPESRQESAPVTESESAPTPAPVPQIAPPASPLAGSEAVEKAAVRWVMQLERAAGRKPKDRRSDTDFPADIESPPRIIEVKAIGTSTRDSILPLDVKQFDKAQQLARYYIYVVENTSQGDPTEFTLKILAGKRLHQLLARARERHYYELPWPAAHYDEAPGMEGLSGSDAYVEPGRRSG